MARVEGTAARKFDFEGAAGTGEVARRSLRLAPARVALRGPGKYKELDHRRHQAQIAARRLLALLD